MDPLTPLLQALEETNDSTTIRSIVGRILSDAGIFHGYNRIAVSDPPPLAATLQLFSYGTIQQYQAEPDKCMSLSGAQLLKLQQLTVLSVLQQHAADTIIPFTSFQPLQNIEELLLSCLYSGAIEGQLTPTGWIMGKILKPRDVPPSRVPLQLQELQNLQSRIRHARTYLQQEETKMITQHKEDEKLSKEKKMEWTADSSSRRLKRGRGSTTTTTIEGEDEEQV